MVLFYLFYCYLPTKALKETYVWFCNLEINYCAAKKILQKNFINIIYSKKKIIYRYKNQKYKN